MPVGGMVGLVRVRKCGKSNRTSLLLLKLVDNKIWSEVVKSWRKVVEEGLELYMKTWYNSKTFVKYVDLYCVIF